MILYNNNFIRGVKMKSQNNEFENEKNKTVTESLKSNKSKKTTNDTIDAKSSDKKNVNKNTNTNPKNSKKKKDKMDKKEKISKPEKVSENSDSNTTLDKTLKEKNHKNTIGIIVSKRNDKFILEYVSDLSLMLTTYKLENNLKKATA